MRIEKHGDIYCRCWVWKWWENTIHDAVVINESEKLASLVGCLLVENSNQEAFCWLVFPHSEPGCLPHTKYKSASSPPSALSFPLIATFCNSTSSWRRFVVRLLQEDWEAQTDQPTLAVTDGDIVPASLGQSTWLSLTRSNNRRETSIEVMKGLELSMTLSWFSHDLDRDFSRFFIPHSYSLYIDLFITNRIPSRNPTSCPNRKYLSPSCPSGPYHLSR